MDLPEHNLQIQSFEAFSLINGIELSHSLLSFLSHQLVQDTSLFGHLVLTEFPGDKDVCIDHLMHSWHILGSQQIITE